MDKPDILVVLADQFRHDCIAALGNPHIWTPNLDRLAARGVSCTNAYTPCPVCIPARFSIRTGCEPLRTRNFSNGHWDVRDADRKDMQERCGPYLAHLMKARGYRTFGAGKFHAQEQYPALGYERSWLAEELKEDDYVRWLRAEHPEFAHVEMPHGERSEMYYQPQTSPLPAELCHEAWCVDRYRDELEAAADDDRPHFGLVSFIGPHPPLAPPVPYNRMYDPDRLPDPVLGDEGVDTADAFLAQMNYGVWAEGHGGAQARLVRSRYYGDVTYIDTQVGRLLDAIEARPDPDNVLVVFAADHGDHLGDHRAWQKEGFFEASVRVPLLVSWPRRLPADERREDLVSLIDLVPLCTAAGGEIEQRDGMDLLGVLAGEAAAREELFSWHQRPKDRSFKMMCRRGRWKYVHLANGDRELLFDLAEDPDETRDLAETHPEVVLDLRTACVRRLRASGDEAGLDGDRLRGSAFAPLPHRRIMQTKAFGERRAFPAHPSQALAE